MVRISEKVPGKEDSVVAIKMVFGTRDQSKPIRDLLRRHGVFSRKESSANLGLCGLTSAPSPRRSPNAADSRLSFRDTNA